MGNLVILDPLSTDEQRLLERCEADLRDGLLIAHQALITIQERRLYRATHATFEEYCREIRGYTSSRGWQMVAAARVVGLLLADGQDPPTNERQARELGGLSEDDVKAVWRVVKETAPTGKVTAAHVKSVVNVMREVMVTGAIDNGTGVDIPIERASITHVKAAVVEETSERLARQAAHIAEREQMKYVGTFPATADYGALYTQKDLPVLHGRHYIIKVFEVIEENSSEHSQSETAAD